MADDAGGPYDDRAHHEQLERVRTIEDQRGDTGGQRDDGDYGGRDLQR